MNYTITNVKIHFKVLKKIIIPEKIKKECKKYNNFFVFRLKSFTFSIFEQSGHVNISGLKNFQEISNSIDIFNRFFNTNINTSDIIIDNSTANDRISTHQKINLPKFKTIFDKEKKNSFQEIRLSLFPNFFPAIIIRAPNKPTVLFFASGKFIIIGAKSEKQIEEKCQQIHALMKDPIFMINTQEIQFALNVD